MNATAQNIIRGLIAGDTAGAMNADFHIHSLPPKRVGRLRFLSKLSDEDHVTNVPRPFAHANPPALLHPAPAEATEWFVFSYRLQHLSSDAQRDAWLELARDADASRAGVRIGTRSALINLKRGLEPHQAGNDNPHYFDDLAMIRAAAAVAVHDTTESALEAATRDAQYTTALDGLWCAQATAALLGRLAHGSTPADAVQEALDLLPDETWSRRVALEALETAQDHQHPISRARRLSVDVGDWIYSYPTAAPETLAFLLAHVSVAKSAEDLMLGVLGQPRNAATLPALAGIAAVLIFGDEWVPDDLSGDRSTLAGLTMSRFAGLTVQEALSA